jgi:hypothetical protein
VLGCAAQPASHQGRMLLLLLLLYYTRVYQEK